MEFFLIHIFPYLYLIPENTDQKKLLIWTLFVQWLLLMNEIHTLLVYHVGWIFSRWSTTVSIMLIIYICHAKKQLINIMHNKTAKKLLTTVWQLSKLWVIANDRQLKTTKIKWLTCLQVSLKISTACLSKTSSK